MALLLLLTAIGPVPARAAGGGLGTVVVAVEKFSIGQGYLIEPTLVPIQAGDSCGTILLRVLQQNGYQAKYDEGYLRGIYGADSGYLNIPECIQRMRNYTFGGQTFYAPDNNATNEYYQDNRLLSEFSYNKMAGWFFSVNDNAPAISMWDYMPNDQDVMRVMFTVFGRGEDVADASNATGGSSSYKRGYDLADKSELTRKIAEINAEVDRWKKHEKFNEYYKNAITTLCTVNARDADVSRSLDQLEYLERNLPTEPTQITLSQKTLSLTLGGDAVQLGVTALPVNADLSGLSFESKNASVASVDADGWVRPAGIGSTVITARTPNGCTDTCQVTVAGRPMTSVHVTPASWALTAGKAVKLSAGWEPADTTDSTSFTWESSAPSVASVAADGTVTALSAGTADITARFANGKSASCHITVAADQQGLADAVRAKILALPDPDEILTMENVRAVEAAVEEYNGLAPEVRVMVGEDARTRLDACSQAAAARKAAIAESEKRVAAVEAALAALPGPSAVTYADRGKIVEARALYGALLPEEQAQVPTDLLARLVSCELRLSELEQESSGLHEAVGKLPAELSVDDYPLLAEVEEKLQQLGSGALSAEELARYEAAGRSLAASITEAANAADAAGSLDPGGSAVKAFLKAQEAYDALSDGIRGMVTSGTQAVMAGVRGRIASAIAVSGGISMEPRSSYWYAGLTVKERKDGASVAAEVEKKLPGRKVSAKACFDISWYDIRDGKEWTPELAAALSVPVKDYSAQTTELYYVTYDGNGNISRIVRLNAAYAAASQIAVVHASEPGCLLVSEVRIPIRGISLGGDVRVGKGQKLQFTAVPVPLDTTEELNVSWETADKAIAKVNKKGMVTGVKTGTTTLTASVPGTELAASCKVTVTDKADGLSASVADVMDAARSYILSTDKNPTLGSEWYVLGLARGGMKLNDSYFTTYYNHIANYLKEQGGVLDRVKYTEYSKMALAMTAIGKDARDIAGYDMFAPLADMDKLTGQGINSVIFALIAADSSPDYDIPTVKGVAVQATKEKLLSAILGAQCADGGWSLAGGSGDPDITGMALTALAPYYKEGERQDVAKAVERGLNCLSSMQRADGGFGSWGTVNSESDCQVLTALTSLGIDPASDARFVRNGKWVLTHLLSFRTSEGGFKHTQDGKTNGMATEQAYYALAAYQRFLDGKTSLYDMSDLTVKPGGSGDGSGTGIQDPAADNQSSTPGGTGAAYTGRTSGGSSYYTGRSSGASAGTSYTGRTSGASSGGTASAKKKSASAGSSGAGDTEEPWSFEGGDYEGETLWDISDGGVPRSDADAALGGGYYSQEKSGLAALLASAYMPYVLCIAIGAAVLGGALYYRRKI